VGEANESYLRDVTWLICCCCYTDGRGVLQSGVELWLTCVGVTMNTLLKIDLIGFRKVLAFHSDGREKRKG
jgi:hypothetical protein